MAALLRGSFFFVEKLISKKSRGSHPIGSAPFVLSNSSHFQHQLERINGENTYNNSAKGKKTPKNFAVSKKTCNFASSKRKCPLVR
ncbi:MAG TPA: hypothetical protein PLN34_03925 [Alloprevotella sp.]|nr:hypothetical protein [Alloprevotella sp.]